MVLSGSYEFKAAPDVVWNLLIDPSVVARCLPGCHRLEPVGEDRYRAELTLAVAALTGEYTATVAILDKNPPHSYKLVVDGRGSPGFVKGEGTIELVPQGDGTLVTVAGHAHAGGLIARVGQRLLGSVSKMMVDRFFTDLQRLEQTAGPS